MCHQLESMCQGQTSAFADALDPTLGVRLHCRWVVNLEGGFGRRHPAASILSLPPPWAHPGHAWHRVRLGHRLGPRPGRRRVGLRSRKTHRNSTLSLFTWHATPRHHSKTTTHNTHLRITMFFSNKMLPHFPVVCLLSMCTQECGPSRFDTHPSGGRLFYDLGRGCNSCIFTGHKYAIPDFVCRPNLNSIYCQLHKSTREHHFEFRGVGYQICTSNIFIYLN